MTITLPDDPALLSNVGSALRWGNQFDLAADCLNRSLALNLASGEAWNNRGQLHEDLGEWPEACTAYQNAYSLRPDIPTIALSLAYQRMRMGEWNNEPWTPAGAPEGTKPFPGTWDLWEAGRQNYGTLPNIPIWQGDEDLTGDRLLITWEGGFGDAIWLSRYLPKLSELVGLHGDLAMIVPDSLCRLMDKRIAPEHGRFIPASTLPRCRWRSVPTYQIPLLSILTRFLRDSATVPAVSLKSADKGIPPVLGVRFNHGAANGLKTGFTESPESWLRVGLVPAAQEVGVQRPHRSIPAMALAPLAEVPGVEWVSLMPDRYATWAKPMSWLKPQNGPEWGWEDTAQAIEQLDLVVSVDTAVAHLAASLGVLTWMLVPRRADWKWGLPGICGDYQTSVWYPGVSRIFRQTDPVSWDSVIQEVCRELAAITQAKVAAPSV